MFYVYILKLSDGKFYTGFSTNLKRRLQEHNAGNVTSTKHRIPIKLVHYEAYLIKSDATRREKYLKTTNGKKLLRKQIRDLFEKVNQGEVA